VNATALAPPYPLARGLRLDTAAFRLVVSGLWLTALHALPPTLESLLFWILPAAALLRAARTPADPGFFYAFFFFLYNASFLAVGGILEPTVTPEEVQILRRAAAAGFAGVWVGAALARPDRPPGGPEQLAPLFRGVPLLLVLLLTLCTAYPLVEAASRGFASKQEFKRSGAFSVRFLVFLYPLMFTAMGIIHHHLRAGRPRTAWRWWLAAAVWFTLIFAVVGERDAIFMFGCLSAFYALEVLRWIRPRHVLAAMLIGLASVQLLHNLKGFLLYEPGEAREKELAWFPGEFLSASRNFWLFLDHRGDEQIGAELLAMDLRRFLDSGLFGTKQSVSSTEWFNRQFLAKKGAGLGFSLLAEWYAVGRLAGCFAFFLAWTVLLTALHRRRARGLGAYLIFSGVMLVSCYALRADMSNLLGFSLKTVVLPLLSFAAYDRVMRRLRPAPGAGGLA
jgi:hypothetical protein